MYSHEYLIITLRKTKDRNYVFTWSPPPFIKTRTANEQEFAQAHNKSGPFVFYSVQLQLTGHAKGYAATFSQKSFMIPVIPCD